MFRTHNNTTKKTSGLLLIEIDSEDTKSIIPVNLSMLFLTDQ
jgi:hypothetical protein